MAEVSEWCTDTQQQQKLSLHSRKRRRSLEETHSRKSPAVSLTWSTPQVLEGERESGNGRKPQHAYGHKQEGIQVGILGPESRPPAGLPTAVRPSTAQPSNMALSLTKSSCSQGMQGGRTARASTSPACQGSGISKAAYQAKASYTASAPARLPSAVAKPDVLASVPARRHHSAEHEQTLEKLLSNSASPSQGGQRSRAHSQPGFAHDTSVDATPEQWGMSAGGAASMLGRSRSVATFAAGSSSSGGSGSAANATQALMQVCACSDVACPVRCPG